MSVTVFTGAWGAQYRHHIPGWWQAVLALDPAPDEVLLVTAVPDRIGLADSAASVPLPVRVVQHHGPHTVARFWNTAAEHAAGDWLVPCPIDDRLLPEALVEIPAAGGAELFVDAVRFKNTGEVWRGQWLPERIGSGMTLPTFCPFRRSLRHRMPVLFPDIYFSDWGFYMHCAAVGVTAYHASTVRMLYNDDLGVGRESDMGPELQMERQREAFNYAVSLGLAAATAGP